MRPSPLIDKSKGRKIIMTRPPHRADRHSSLQSWSGQRVNPDNIDDPVPASFYRIHSNPENRVADGA